MTLDEFIRLAESDQADPPELPTLLLALWFDRRGDWSRAHQLAQTVPSADGSWVHAYLHRREGDLGNARYWYSRAHQDEFQGTFRQEWEMIAEKLLEQL